MNQRRRRCGGCVRARSGADVPPRPVGGERALRVRSAASRAGATRASRARPRRFPPRQVPRRIGRAGPPDAHTDEVRPVRLRRWPPAPRGDRPQPPPPGPRRPARPDSPAPTAGRRLAPPPVRLVLGGGWTSPRVIAALHRRSSSPIVLGGYFLRWLFFSQHEDHIFRGRRHGREIAQVIGKVMRRRHFPGRHFLQKTSQLPPRVGPKCHLVGQPQVP